MNYLAMPEQWRQIPGLEGFYDASSHGNIRSVSRQAGKRWHEGQVLKPCPRDKYGRLKVSISVNGKVTYADVAVLVARAWLPPGEPGDQVCHGRAGLTDNSPDNLYYGTSARNMEDRHRDGTWPDGENNGNARLTWEIVTEIRRRHAAGERQKDLAREFGVTPGAVAHIIHGRQWVRGPEDLAITSPRGQAGSSNPQAKLTQAQAEEIRRRYASGERQKDLAAVFGVAPSAISAIVRNRRWSEPGAAACPDGRVKLTWEIVDQIRARYPGETQAALAREFGVTDVMVSLIVRNKAWVK